MAPEAPCRDVVLTPITALGFLTLDPSPAYARGTYLLVGEDTQLKIYDVDRWRLCGQLMVFAEQSIHGIHVSSGSVLIWGSRSVTVCSVETIAAALGAAQATNRELAQAEAPDWIYDGRISPVDPNSGVLVTAHNEVVPISWVDTPSQGGPTISFGEAVSPSRPILYSAHLKWLSPGCILVAGGTVFGEILVWTCRSDDAGRRTCEVLHVLSGHEGSIFGVHISDEIQLADGGPLRLLASCSDDRTIRVWDVSDASSSAGEASGASTTDLLHEARETGFGSAGIDEGKGVKAPITMAMGHISRIWHVEFPPLTTEKLPTTVLPLYSFGEDSTSQRWELDLTHFQRGAGGETGRLINKDIFSNHDGKHIWAAALMLNDDQSHLIATGGADGKVALIKENRASSQADNKEGEQEGPASLSTVSHETLPLLEPVQVEKVQKGRNRHDFLHRYAFITEDTLLTATKFGKLLLGLFSSGGDISWSEVSITEDETRDDIKACSAITSAGPGVAIVGTTTKNLYLYSDGRISKLVSVPGKVLNLICLGQTEASITFLLTMYDNHDVKIFTADLASRLVTSDICLDGVDERFVLTSAGRFHGYLIIGSRNGFMEGFTAQDDQYVPTIRIDPRSDDAITSIIPLPGQANAEKISFLTTNRDGKYRIYELDITDGNAPRAYLRHETSPPFGPQIEDAWFCKDGDGPADLILSGFRSKNFVVWNETKRESIAGVDCGGAHRTFAHTKSPVAGHLRFAFTKASKVYIHSQEQTNCSTLKSGTHGREIRAIAAREPSPPTGVSYFATGSEDTSIRIWERASSSGIGSRLRCVASMKIHTTGIQCLKWCGQDYLLSSGGNEDFFVWRVSKLDADFAGLAVFCEAALPDKTPDADLRITDFDVTAEGGDGCLLITMAFSNSTFKTYGYRSPAQGSSKAQGTFELLAVGEYTGACLTQVRQLGLGESGPAACVLTASTDGYIALWRLENKGSTVSYTFTSATRIHQSSIKGLDLRLLLDSNKPPRYLVTTAGDDNAVAATLVSLDADNGKLTVSGATIVKSAHAAAINGVVSLGDGRVATVSNDQRLKLWRVREGGMGSLTIVLEENLPPKIKGLGLGPATIGSPLPRLTSSLPNIYAASHLPAHRSLSTTPTYLKKKDKGSPKSSSKSAPAASSSSSPDEAGHNHPSPNPDDPHNFADITSRFTKLSERYKSDLKQFRQGGKSNPDVIGALPVATKGGETFPLRELAQVVSRGRSISLLVNDKSFVKPVMSAVQASELFNQQPQRDPENELELVMKVEMERPEEVARRLKDLCHRWRERVREVKTKRDKVIAAWGKDNVVSKDVKHKLGTELMDLVKKELADIDRLEAQAIAQAGKSGK
ncbi:hypothetical protein SAPIO_CDS1430 [Scedosporium apiospermum]|uniref:Ribosome recycling factor domain-containing protein n=1 Tax=Pseudallescheria apiosperma TaxID=563466 RepID=A0A084GFB0_PSEDA|nr:uncharacterized protein SAPIO_CDS1430 [Scedosporium apiospermum]KEZ46022.1 hypothetical protein SAPIO_CDS1430 [Scedosporium apiospermum]